MRILHVITSLHTGGAEKLMVDLLPRLCDKGFDVDLLIFDGSKTPFYQMLKERGLNIIDFGESNSVYALKNIRRLRKLIRNYDIVHTHNTSPQFYTAIANIGLNKKLVTTEHNTYNRRRAWIGFSVIDRWMYNRYKSIICISDQAEVNLKKYVGDSTEKIVTIYNGVDIAKFSETVISSSLKDDLPKRENIKTMIMVAAFRNQKDQDTAIKAIKHLSERFHLFFVGDGARRGICERLSQDLGLMDRIHFLGVRSDVAELLHAADYVVMSSHFEGLSLSSVEGMSVGKPVIASDVDGLREVVQGAGVLFPHQDAEALAGEIIKLDESSELYRSVADACYERACQFDISKMVEGYSEIYNSLNE